VLLKKTGYTLQKNTEHCNNHIIKTNYDEALKTARFSLIFVGNGRHALRVRAPAQAASLRRLVRVARDPGRKTGLRM